VSRRSATSKEREPVKVPVLITIDLHRVEGIAEYGLIAAAELRRLGISATFFIPALVLEENQAMATGILEAGHEIASHGLFHNDREPFRGYPPERYDLLNEKAQRRVIGEATAKFEELLGRAPTCFRSPCFGISPATLRILEEHGYQADFSVNSQRLDLLTSQPFSLKHMLAPRLPYHPNRKNPFRDGESQIWEIPLSAFILPFAVMTLITFGSNFMELFFRRLYKESRKTQKPIVYMCHAEEFSPSGSTYTIPFSELGWRDFLPMKGKGIMARQAFRIGDPAKIHEYNRNFLSYMGSFEDIEFVTGSRYIQTYLQLSA
jgi:hypothetical protein